MYELPTEIICEVGGFLFATDMVRLSMTCARLHEILEDKYKMYFDVCRNGGVPDKRLMRYIVFNATCSGNAVIEINNPKIVSPICKGSLKYAKFYINGSIHNNHRIFENILIVTGEARGPRYINGYEIINDKIKQAINELRKLGQNIIVEAVMAASQNQRARPIMRFSKELPNGGKIGEIFSPLHVTIPC